jgi:hypothetical protein
MIVFAANHKRRKIPTPFASGADLRESAIWPKIHLAPEYMYEELRPAAGLMTARWRSQRARHRRGIFDEG